MQVTLCLFLRSRHSIIFNEPNAPSFAFIVMLCTAHGHVIGFTCVWRGLQLCVLFVDLSCRHKSEVAAHKLGSLTCGANSLEFASFGFLPLQPYVLFASKLFVHVFVVTLVTTSWFRVSTKTECHYRILGLSGGWAGLTFALAVLFPLHGLQHQH